MVTCGRNSDGKWSSGGRVHRRRWRGAVVSLVAATSLTLAACGSDEAASTTTAAVTTAASTTVASTAAASSTTAASTTAAPTTVAPTSTAASSSVPTSDVDPATANAVVVTTPGMSYAVSGSLRPGVATITLRNTDTVAHAMAIGRLKPGVGLDDVRAAMAAEGSDDSMAPLLADPPDAAVYGTPALVGAGEETTVTATDLPAGNYVLLCFLTDASGTPHVQMGMLGLLEVSGDPFTQRPESAGTVTLNDDGIELPAGFSGRGTYLVTNAGTAPHSLSIARLDAGVTLDAYFQHVAAAMGGGGAVDGGGGQLVGGIDDLLPGQSAYLTLDLRAGHYGYVSAVDAQGPEMPALHGEFDVS